MTRLLCTLFLLFVGNVLPAAAQEDWLEQFKRNAARNDAYRQGRPYRDYTPPRRETQPAPYQRDTYQPPTYAPRQIAPDVDVRTAIVREEIPQTIQFPGNVIIVFRDSQQYSAFVDGKAAYFGDMALRGPVSTGLPGRYETPLTDLRRGPHSIEFKQINYVSRTYPEPYGGAPMPYAMFFDRKNGFALHEGEIPRWRGHASGVSKGCVRLERAHARILFEYFSDATVRVIIVENVASLRQWEESIYARS